MLKLKYTSTIFLIVMLSVVALSCGSNSEKPIQSSPPAFEVLDSKLTGLNFANKLTPTAAFNMFDYMYFYNGAGVGAGDFNNDGLVDLFFASNQSQNKMYLNKGGMHFTDVTDRAQIPRDSSWSTGVSVVDINNDGKLDIYVCRVGHYEDLHGKNQMLVCKGIDSSGTPFYEDEANTYGLDFSGFSTQAAFFDYDMDGDLDMYLMNHSVRNNGTFGARSSFIGTHDPLAGDRLYRNEGNRFTDVTKQSRINSSAIGYGLGICVADINVDGWPDLYIGNDFHENDYLYINQKNGTFKDELTNCMMHTSQFTMGVDVADINNDGYPEMVTMDMLPSDPYILKRSLGEDEYNLFNMKLDNGYIPQYTRNNLQLNLRNGYYSEVGRYAGIYATDWSWAALWMDFDNDGLKDLFVSNGIPKRLNDMDYVNYISNDEVQQKIRDHTMKDQDMALIDKFPEIKLPNKFFHNRGNAAFDDTSLTISGDRPTFSNGAVYADLDNDGDLDIVVNNITDSVLVYQNKSNDQQDLDYLQLTLKGPLKNGNAIGAKLVVYAGETITTYEKNPARGFLSSMEIPMQAGLNNQKPDSIKLVWPDNSCQLLPIKKGQHQLTVSYKKGLPGFDYGTITHHHPNPTRIAEDLTLQSQLFYRHTENNFVEFDREPLMPHMASREGPALAVADINGDHLDDVFIGSARGYKAAIFLQQQDGRFIKTNQQAIDLDSNYEDVSACWTDVNKDGFTDLVVASGGNEYFGRDSNNTPRVYLNNGRSQFNKLSHAFDSLYLTASCVVPYDFNEDGFVDLFIGGRAVSFDYGKMPTSYLMQNDGKGHFTDVTNKYSKELSNAGFVTNAVWFDMDSDGDKDLVLSCEWGGIDAYINNNHSFSKKQLTGKKGWWNFVLPVDIDKDGDIDLLAGNLGLNSRLTASADQPVRMYYADFDGNGKKEQVITYYLQGREIPFANKGEMEKQLPVMKKQYLYAADFANASLTDMFNKEKLETATVLTADYFSNSLLINDGNLNFTVNPLPWQAQLTCFKDAIVIDANNDYLPDILPVGNFYANNIQMGRYDGDLGTILVNNGNATFNCSSLNGPVVKGQVRHIRNLHTGNGNAILMARNNDSLQLIRLK